MLSLGRSGSQDWGLMIWFSGFPLPKNLPQNLLIQNFPNKFLKTSNSLKTISKWFLEYPNIPNDPRSEHGFFFVHTIFTIFTPTNNIILSLWSIFNVHNFWIFKFWCELKLYNFWRSGAKKRFSVVWITFPKKLSFIINKMHLYIIFFYLFFCCIGNHSKTHSQHRT